MAQLTDISDIASLAATLQRTANTASHFAALCEQKDREIDELKEQVAAKEK